MSRIPDEIIEQVRDTADLLEIVQESVELKRTGSDWRGACPFHQGSHRNFAVIPRKNRYYCFVCHASGDVFTWYRERFGMDYPTAVREVAKRYGIAIPESTERSGPDPREPLYQACDAAQTWFAAQLRDSVEAEPARRYLLQRDFSLDVAATLGIGYAPRGGEFLAAMKQLGIEDDVLIESTLAGRRDDGTLHPRFRGRLLFPIHDLRGRVVGFGGRALGSVEPKYLNSAESPIFHKGEQLYNIHQARNAIRKAGSAVVVEGYFDVQRLVLIGIEQVVAPLGTAFTAAQAALLKRYSSDVILLYDSDSAGLKATFRAADTLLDAGLRVRVATLPVGEDPDTLGQRGGAAAVERVLADAVDVMERKLQLLDTRGWFNDVHKAREALDRLLPTIRAASDPVTRELYTTRVAERLGIPRDTVASEAARQLHLTPVNLPAAPRTNAASGVGRRLPGAEIERKLLRLLLRHPDWLTRARGEVLPSRFETPAFRAIYEALLQLPPGAPPTDVLDRLDPRSREALTRLLELDPSPIPGFDVDREYTDALEALAEIASFPEIEAEPDPVVRRLRLLALSKEGQTRFSLYHRSGAHVHAARRNSPSRE